MAAAANAGDKPGANAALARVTAAMTARRALVGVPTNANLNSLVAGAKANVARAVRVAKTRAAEAAQADAAARAAAKAEEARVAAEAKAAAAARAAANKQTAAAARAAEAAQAALNKAAANAQRAAEKAAAANAKIQKDKIRNFVLKIWPLTKGNTNSRTKLWTPRLKNNTNLIRRINSLKGNLTEAEINAIKQNINLAAKNRKIGYFRAGLIDVVDGNLKNRLGQVKWLVNLGLGPRPSPQAPWRVPVAQREAAGAKIAKAWKNQRSEKRVRAMQNAVKAAAAAEARARAMTPGGAARRGALFAQSSAP